MWAQVFGFILFKLTATIQASYSIRYIVCFFHDKEKRIMVKYLLNAGCFLLTAHRLDSIYYVPTMYVCL